MSRSIVEDNPPVRCYLCVLGSELNTYSVCNQERNTQSTALGTPEYRVRFREGTDRAREVDRVSYTAQTDGHRSPESIPRHTAPATGRETFGHNTAMYIPVGVRGTARLDELYCSSFFSGRISAMNFVLPWSNAQQYSGGNYYVIWGGFSVGIFGP